MKECFDVLDENRNHLGYTKERGETLLENEYNTGAEGFIISHNLLLITQRSMNKSHAGMWEVPGGCSQAGETTYDTLKREMLEEVGVEINQNNIKFLGTKIYKKQFVDIFQIQTDIDIHQIKIQEEEVSDAKFVNKEEFNQLVQENKIVPSVLERWNYIKDQVDLNW